MPKAKFRCLYCGEIFIIYVSDYGEVELPKCPKCGDRDVKHLPTKDFYGKDKEEG